MITLGELFAWLLVGLVIAWLWRGHGIRERALSFVRQHCKNAGVQLLDGNVALKGWRMMTDGKGQKRLARQYGFEFTVTSQERLNGTVAMFGNHLGKIEMQAYPLSESASYSHDAIVVEPQAQQRTYTAESNVVELNPGHDRKK
ncbi:MAG TPA: DUF3301 domain-containing protein [Thiopseudomonas sp.]|nr:DUF3301 domain-containing protein [Thiopseudomonas sp.]